MDEMFVKKSVIVRRSINTGHPLKTAGFGNFNLFIILFQWPCTTGPAANLPVVVPPLPD
jgi:hypothetical protein